MSFDNAVYPGAIEVGQPPNFNITQNNILLIESEVTLQILGFIRYIEYISANLALFEAIVILYHNL